jgi:hypothetical protein
MGLELWNRAHIIGIPTELGDPGNCVPHGVSIDLYPISTQ